MGLVWRTPNHGALPRQWHVLDALDLQVADDVLILLSCPIPSCARHAQVGGRAGACGVRGLVYLRACVHACVRACVRACVHARVQRRFTSRRFVLACRLSLPLPPSHTHAHARERARAHTHTTGTVA